MAGRLFVHRDGEPLIRVEKVDSSYAYITVISDQPRHYGMPMSEYNSVFVERYRPATAEDIARIEGEGDVPLPENAPPEWQRSNVLTDSAGALD